MKTKDWFETWFDSPYYHILYKNRDESEAHQFIQNLAKQLRLKPKSNILDLACGRGRHSKALSEMGFCVTGVDLSEHSIAFAKKFESSRLFFEVHDMREIYKPNSFDFVVNLFTSFGYFNHEKDNLRVLNSVSRSLKQNGQFLLDFMNCGKIDDSLNNQEEKEIDGIRFHISKEIRNNHIIKTIRFEDDGKAFQFEEKVSTLKFEKMKELFAASELQIMSFYGDYSFNPFNEKTSDRLIILAQKIQ